MPEYLPPGVFVEDIERGPKPIEGVATSTAAFLGETARGTRPPLWRHGAGRGGMAQRALEVALAGGRGRSESALN